MSDSVSITSAVSLFRTPLIREVLDTPVLRWQTRLLPGLFTSPRLAGGRVHAMGPVFTGELPIHFLQNVRFGAKRRMIRTQR
jgi:hypothetical protein